jgi:hypothetical protein
MAQNKSIYNFGQEPGGESDCLVGTVLEIIVDDELAILVEAVAGTVNKNI